MVMNHEHTPGEFNGFNGQVDETTVNVLYFCADCGQEFEKEEEITE